MLCLPFIMLFKTLVTILSVVSVGSSAVIHSLRAEDDSITLYAYGTGISGLTVWAGEGGN
jgi:hypothetical protein